ncbi:other/BUB protein kinase [Amanita muscaria]
MAPSRLSPEDRERERQRYRTKLAKALTEEDDPLAVYYQFVEWTLKQYGEKDTKSGLKPLLEEATRVFKEDQVYKTDLRYLKLWSLHVRQLPRADGIGVYASLLSNNIGTDYSMLYEEYAHLLEKDGKAEEANSIYCKGIERNARPRERLKNRYREFQSRSSSKPSTSNNPPSAPSPSSQLQRAASVTMISTSSTPQSRYAVMLAPPAPGKRPEKFRFNISLLFTEESGEYSIQEARAKSMGLLGKKWAPLSVANLSSSASTIGDDANTDMQKSTRTGNVLRRKSLYGGGAEPTVTINTKEALADVFGMYNSPDKTRSMGLTGTKHAPLKKVEPITPIAQPRFTATNENENRSRNENDPPHNFKTPTATFRPFVDENANANHITPATGKFTPFVDPSANKTPSATNSRPVLSIKETSLASSSKSSSSPRLEFSSAATPSSSEAVFSKVFTPAGREQTPPLAPLREAFTDHHGKPQSKFKLPTHERAQSHSALSSPSACSEVASSSKNVHPFRPLVDSENAWTPFKVFSRPPGQEHAQSASHEPQTASGDSGSSNLGKENPFTPKTPVAAPDTKPPAFTPFRDENKASTFGAATPAFKPFVDPADKENAPAAPASVFAKPGHLLVEAQPRAVLASNAGWPSSGVSSSSSSSFSDLAEIPEHAVQYEDEYDDDEYDEEGDDLDQAQGMAAHSLQQHGVETDSEYEYEGESFQDAHHHHHYQDPEGIPLGGRFGQINVMTPITERTIEYTMNTCAGTPSDRLRSNEDMGKYFDEGEEEEGDFDMREFTGYQHRSELNAQRAAERLAAELQAEEEEENSLERKKDALYPHGGGEYPGGLSLADTLTLSSKFKPPNPCNPFDAAILSTLLSRIPLDSHFYDLRNQESGMLDALQKFTKSSGRKSGVDLTYFSLNLNDQRFSVSEKLGEGGFGSVFKARILGARPPDSDEEDEEDLEDGDESALSYVALKVVRPRNLWEYHVLRRLHSALPPVARRSVVLPHCLYAFKDESFLILDFCPQGTLLTTVNNAVAAGVSQQGGSLDELLVMFFSIELLRLVEAMHSVGFIHGDLKIDNCLLRLEDVPGGVSAWSSMYQPSGESGWASKGLRIIDFGRTIDTRLFPNDQQYLAEWETDERDCFEARENQPWTYQADYFGLAGIIYCMLFGKYLQTSSIVVTQKDDLGRRYKIGTPFKRYWQADLWNRIFDILLNPSLVRADSSSPLCGELGELRKDMEKWLRANCNRSSNTLKGLLKKVEMASLR